MKNNTTAKLLAYYFFLLVFVALPLIIPEWMKQAEISDFQTWYPRIGKLLFFFLHYLMYVLSILSMVILLRVGYINLEIRRKKIFYGGALLLLSLQYYYCYTHQEFYPAVMMPLFSFSKFDTDEISHTTSELAITTKNTSLTIDTESMLKDIPLSIRETMINNSFLEEIDHEYDKTLFLNWLTDRLGSKLSFGDTIQTVAFYKVISTFSFNRKLTLIKQEKHCFQIINR